MKNRIYVFTGTGNSLYVAKKIGEGLGDCEILGINQDTSLVLEEGFDRVGVIFPCYAGGLPTMVKKFIENIQFPNQGNTYFFAITTMGGNGSQAIPMFNKALEGKNWKLNFGEKILAFPNFIVGYPMIRGVKFFDKRTNNGISKTINKIINKEVSIIGSVAGNTEINYEKFMIKFKDTVEHYNVSDNCTSCGICTKVCPSRNIKLKDGKPTFKDKCEKCVACIQSCPVKAINYKDKTQKRRRYTNPNISINEIIKNNR